MLWMSKKLESNVKSKQYFLLQQKNIKTFNKLKNKKKYKRISIKKGMR